MMIAVFNHRMYSYLFVIIIVAILAIESYDEHINNKP